MGLLDESNFKLIKQSVCIIAPDFLKSRSVILESAFLFYSEKLPWINESPLHCYIDSSITVYIRVRKHVLSNWYDWTYIYCTTVLYIIPWFSYYNIMLVFINCWPLESNTVCACAHYCMWFWMLKHKKSIRKVLDSQTFNNENKMKFTIGDVFCRYFWYSSGNRAQ